MCYISGYCYFKLFVKLFVFNFMWNAFVDEVVVSVCCLSRGDYFNFVFNYSVTKESLAEYEVCVPYQYFFPSEW